jgi:hypothetical protein
MSTDRVTAPIDSLGYGTAADLSRLLDGVSVLLREEPQFHWNEDADLREASKAVADHLYSRLGISPENDSYSGCHRQEAI